LLDGEEDRNADGVLDDNETDPQEQDTDGDGTLDASEALQIACARSRQPPYIEIEDLNGDWLLALPGAFDEMDTYSLLGPIPRAGWFQQSTGSVFGFIVIKEPQAGVGFGIEQAETEATYLRNLGDVDNRRSQPVDSWDLFTSATVELDLTLEVAMTASQLRDEIAAGMARRAPGELGPATGATGSSATQWVVRYSATMRTEGRVVLVGAIAPLDEVVASEDVYQQLRDVTDSTVLAQYGDGVTQECERVPVAVSGFQVDVLWLVDHSLSMADDRDQVATLSTQFFDTLASTELDFRLAVATTGMHTDDSWILVSPGFSTSRDDFVAQMLDPPGGDLEYGLSTGLKIVRLARGSATSGGTHARPDAKFIVVFLSDEQDQGLDLWIEQNIPGCDPAADATLTDCTPLQDQLEEYQTWGVTAFAITGDSPSGCGAPDSACLAMPKSRAWPHPSGLCNGGSFGSRWSTDLGRPSTPSSARHMARPAAIFSIHPPSPTPCAW
jgi:hypothetical protein